MRARATVLQCNVISNLYKHIDENSNDVGRRIELCSVTDSHDDKLLTQRFHSRTELSNIRPVQATEIERGRLTVDEISKTKTISAR